MDRLFWWGSDTVSLQHWLLRYEEDSAELYKIVASMTEWLENAHPPWVAYQSLMEGRLIGLESQPGVIPVGIDEIWCRCFDKFVFMVDVL